MTSMHHLLGMLDPQDDGERPAKLRTGTITDVGPPVRVRVGGNVVPAALLAGAAIEVGDKVAVITRPGDALVLGRADGGDIWLPLSGGTMTGDIDMDGNAIQNQKATSGIYTASPTISTTSSTVITLTADSDPLGWLSSGEVVPNIADRYQVVTTVDWGYNGGNRAVARTRLNGTRVTQSNSPMPSAGFVDNQSTVTVTCNGSTDAIDVLLFQDSGSDQTPDVQVTVTLLPGH